MSTVHRPSPPGAIRGPSDTEEFEAMARLPEGAARDRLRERLVRTWLPMANRLAHKYRNRGEDAEDLEQVAALGLVKAVRRYDPARGHAFESYAVPMITGEIKKHFRDHTWDVHVPRRVQELRNQVRRAVHDLEPTTPSGHPSVGRLAEHLGLTEEEVRLGLGALRSYASYSLDAPSTTTDDSHTLLDTLGDADRGYEHIILRTAVGPCLRRLPERERHVLFLRFYREMTQESIAEGLGISQMQVSRILRGTCERIRREVEADEPAGRPVADGKTVTRASAAPREAHRARAGGTPASATREGRRSATREDGRQQAGDQRRTDNRQRTGDQRRAGDRRQRTARKASVSPGAPSTRPRVQPRPRAYSPPRPDGAGTRAGVPVAVLRHVRRRWASAGRRGPVRPPPGRRPP